MGFVRPSGINPALQAGAYAYAYAYAYDYACAYA
jgi:hypothetical protein